MYADPRPLFFVTAIVIVGLACWVAYVLTKMREPWPRSTSLAVPREAEVANLAAPPAPEVDPLEALAKEEFAKAGDPKKEGQLDSPKKD
jgi:hypothetical protein